MTPKLHRSITPLLLTVAVLAAAPATSPKRPDFSGAWVAENAPGSEAGVVYRVTQDETGITFQRGEGGPATRYPLDGTESVAINGMGRSVRVSGRWLDDGTTLELKTVQLAEDGGEAATILEQQSFAPDGQSILLRRSVEGPRGKKTEDYIYRPAATPPTRSTPANTPQPPPSPDSTRLAGAGGGLAERFQQLDKNHDEQVSRVEAGNPRWFDALDADKNGLLSRSEVEAFPKSRPETAPASASPATNEPVRSSPAGSGHADGHVPDDVRVSPPGRPMIDPEFNDVQHRVAYWDYTGARLNISVAELDPRTGLLKSESGRDVAVAESVAPNFKEGQWYAHNGPEWGRDRNGWAIYFTKEDAAGSRQMWRAVEKDGSYVPEQLTTKSGGHCGALISQSATAPDTRMLFYIHFDRPAEHTVAWAFASQPNDFHPLPDWRGSHSIARIVGEHHIGYAPRDGNGVTQVVLLDTRTGQSQVVTDEPGDKFDTYGFHTPEFSGELLMMANIDRERLAIFRDVKKDGSPWQKIAELRPPTDSPFQFIYSCEPIAPDNGVNGVSYFSLNATKSKGANRGETGRAAKDGSIWVFGLGKDPGQRLVRRVDEGALSGIQTTRYESESYLGEEEVFLYYERKDPETGRGELRRCRTGIRAPGNSPATRNPQSTEKP